MHCNKAQHRSPLLAALLILDLEQDLDKTMEEMLKDLHAMYGIWAGWTNPMVRGSEGNLFEALDWAKRALTIRRPSGAPPGLDSKRHGSNQASSSGGDGSKGKAGGKGRGKVAVKSAPPVVKAPPGPSSPSVKKMPKAPADSQGQGVLAQPVSPPPQRSPADSHGDGRQAPVTPPKVPAPGPPKTASAAKLEVPEAKNEVQVAKEEPAQSGSDQSDAAHSRKRPKDETARAQTSADSQEKAQRPKPSLQRRQELLAALREVDRELDVEDFVERSGLAAIDKLSQDGHSVYHCLAEAIRTEELSADFCFRVVDAAPDVLLNKLSTGGQPSGSAPLHMLCGSGRDHAETRCQVLRRLVARQADLEVRDSRGSTPLLRAAGVQAVEVVETLLELRADPRAQHSSTRRNAADLGNWKAWKV